MVLSANTEWEIRANGTATGAGGFVTGASGTDYSQQDAVHSTRTDIVIDATTATNITSAADPFAADDVGNLINITSGTGFTAGRYEIVSQAAGVATLDRVVGTVSSTGGSGVLGGAATFLDATFEAMVAGNTAHIAADATHTLTAAISVAKDGTDSSPIKVKGYNTTRGDEPEGADRPLIAAGANSIAFDNYWQIRFLSVTTTASEGLGQDNAGAFHQCKVVNTSGSGSRSAIQIGSNARIILCEGQATNGRGLECGSNGVVYGCYLHDSSDGIYAYTSDSMSFINCITDTCTVGINIGWSGASGNKVINCTLYNCATGALMSDTNPLFMNNIIDNCTAGISASSVVNGAFLDYNNFSNNTTDVTNVTKGNNDTALDPQFTDAANGDFTIGTNLKAKASPTPSFPGGLTNNFLDIGAAQREEAGGGAAVTTATFVGF